MQGYRNATLVGMVWWERGDKQTNIGLRIEELPVLFCH